MRGQKTESIGAILNRTLSSIKIVDHGQEMTLKRRLAQERALQLWPDVVGSHISNHTQPLWVKDSVIFVQVDSPTWSNELVFFKEEIIKKLNQRIGWRIISDIYMRV